MHMSELCRRRPVIVVHPGVLVDGVPCPYAFPVTRVTLFAPHGSFLLHHA